MAKMQVARSSAIKRREMWERVNVPFIFNNSFMIGKMFKKSHDFSISVQTSVLYNPAGQTKKDNVTTSRCHKNYCAKRA